MTQSTLKDAARSLTAALSQRLSTDEADIIPSLAQRALQRRLLSSYAEELDGLDAEGAAAWLLERLSALEARQILQQAEQWQPVVAAHEEPATHPAVPANVIAEPGIQPRGFTIQCDESLAHRGFYPVEYAPDGSAFRWIGPDPHATIYLPRLSRCGEVRIHVYSVFVPETLGDVKVAIDGGQPAGVRLEHEAEHTVLIAQPVPGPLHETATMQLTIDAVRADTPARHGSDDHRELSLAVLRVTINDG